LVSQWGFVLCQFWRVSMRIIMLDIIIIVIQSLVFFISLNLLWDIIWFILWVANMIVKKVNLCCIDNHFLAELLLLQRLNIRFLQIGLSFTVNHLNFFLLRN